MEDLTAEISGPTMAFFQQKFAESKEDFLAILLGIVNVQKYCESDDVRSQTEKNRCKLVVKDWVIINFEDAMDCKTGELNKSALKSLVQGKAAGLKFVGILRFLKVKTVDLTPSFLDRKLMSAVLQSCSWKEPKPHLYLLVWEELTGILSRKYITTTFLLEHMKECSDGPWSRRIPLVVPNLGTGTRVQYVYEFEIGRSEALSEMVSGSDLEECFSFDLENKFQPLNAKFVSGMDLASEKILLLEASRTNIEMEIIALKQKIFGKNSVTREMKAVCGLMSDLKSAMEVNWYDDLAKHVDDNSRDDIEDISKILENEAQTMPLVPVKLAESSTDNNQSVSELETMPIDPEKETKSTEKPKSGELKEKNLTCDLSMKLVLSEEEDFFYSSQ